MKNEIAELMKQINGERVVWVETDGARIDSILLAPPGGHKVTVKPYGYTTKELVAILEDNYFRGYTEDIVSRPSFCLTSYLVEKKDSERVLTQLAELPENGEHDFTTILSRANSSDRSLGNPSCPYG